MYFSIFKLDCCKKTTGEGKGRSQDKQELEESSLGRNVKTFGLFNFVNII